MADIIKKNFHNPDKETEFPKTKIASINLGAFEVSQMVFEPGWRWSDSLPQFIGTETCQYEHPVWMIISGQFAVQMDHDGKIEEFGPGDIGIIPPGHDAWVVGNETVKAIDLQPL